MGTDGYEDINDGFLKSPPASYVFDVSRFTFIAAAFGCN
jgi:hypothetical protein